MIRQNYQNAVKKVLNAKEAREYLGLPRYSFEKAVNNGDIGFKLIGNKKFFPVWCLDKWQNGTTNHIDYTNAAKHTTHTSPMSQKPEAESSLENLLEQIERAKQSNTASKGYRSYKRKTINKPVVNCLV